MHRQVDTDDIFTVSCCSACIEAPLPSVLFLPEEKQSLARTGTALLMDLDGVNLYIQTWKSAL